MSTVVSEPQERSKTADQKYCTDCGSLIMMRAEICPRCGCRQIAAVAPADPRPLVARDPITGPMVVLLALNVLWNGLGNLAIGDRRGWVYGFVNWIFVVLSFFTFFIPLLLFFAFCGYQGYQFLVSSASGAGR